MFYVISRISATIEQETQIKHLSNNKKENSLVLLTLYEDFLQLSCPILLKFR
jgi:predicted GIY-YIG superfamily endonuclease